MLWTFPNGSNGAFNHFTNSGLFYSGGTVGTVFRRLGAGLSLSTTSKPVLNSMGRIPSGLAVVPARYSCSQGGTIMPTESCTIALIRRKQSSTGGTVGPIGLHGTTSGRRCGCNMTGNGIFNWQFGGTSGANAIQAQGAWFPDGNTQYASFSAITLAANSTLAGWYFLAGATNNYNPIWSQNATNEIYFGSGASAGKVAVVKGGATIAQSTTNVTQNVWQHLVITDDGSAIKIYLNGADAGNSVGYTTMAGMQPSRLNQGVNANNFFGRYCEQAVWSRALSGSEVTALYNNGCGVVGDTANAPYDTGFVAGWHGGETTDFSGGGKTLTINNGMVTGTGIVGADFDALGTEIQYLVYTGGRRGMSIYANGRRIGYSATAVTRTDADDDFTLNENAASTGEDQEVFLVAVLDTEWTPDQAMWFYQDPWSCLAPKRNWSFGAIPGGSNNRAAAWMHYYRQMAG